MAARTAFETKREDSDKTTCTLTLDNKDFCCPITQQVFFLPAELSCGHMCERSAISEWKNRGGSCPVCRQPIAELKEPNIFFKKIFENALKENSHLRDDRYFQLEMLTYALENEAKEYSLERIIAVLKGSKKLLNQVSEGNQGVTAFQELSGSIKGRAILVKDPILLSMVTEEGLNSIYEIEDNDKGTSALYWLARNSDGRKLLSENPVLRAKINTIGLNAIRETGVYKGASALYWLAAYPEGRTLLLEDPVLRAKINATGLNAICKACEDKDKGSSVLLWLVRSSESWEILLNDKRLVDLISPITLNTSLSHGKDAGTSAAYCLQNTEGGKLVLAKYPALAKKITPARTTAPFFAPKSERKEEKKSSSPSPSP